MSVVKKNTANKNSSVRRTKENRLILELSCDFGGNKKSRFIRSQEASRLKLRLVVFNN